MPFISIFNVSIDSGAEKRRERSRLFFVLRLNANGSRENSATEFTCEMTAFFQYEFKGQPVYPVGY